MDKIWLSSYPPAFRTTSTPAPMRRLPSCTPSQRTLSRTCRRSAAWGRRSPTPRSTACRGTSRHTCSNAAASPRAIVWRSCCRTCCSIPVALSAPSARDSRSSTATRSTRRELEHQLKDSAPGPLSCLRTSRTRQEVVARTLSSTSSPPNRRPVPAVEAPAHQPGGQYGKKLVPPWRSRVPSPGTPAGRRRLPLDPVALTQETSRSCNTRRTTTACPRTMLTHGNMVANSSRLGVDRSVFEEGAEVVVMPLPASTTFALTVSSPRPATGRRALG